MPGENDAPAPLCPIVRVPHVEICDPTELEPLLHYLSEDLPVENEVVFPRGTLLGDGRLDLCKQSIGPEGCSRIVEALKTNSRVKSVLLGTDAIGDEGAFQVARLIEANPSLEIVYLGCNGITAEGASELAHTLENTESVRGLWLKRNPIGDQGLDALTRMLMVNRTLETLDVVNCAFTQAPLLWLAAILRDQNRSLRRLYLTGNGLGLDAGIACGRMLACNEVLEGLYLSVNHLGDEGTARLCDGLKLNRTLRELSLGSNGIGVAGLQALAEAIGPHPALENLELGRAAAQTALGTEGNDFSGEGASHIAQMLRENRSLKRLSVRGTRIGKEGLQLIDEAARVHPKLAELQMDAPLSSELKAHLAQNRREQGEFIGAQGVQLIRSVYRTA